MNKKVMKLGIMSKEDYRKRTIAIAKGEYRPKRDEPKVWFESPQSMAQVLSNQNRELLKIIINQKPSSLRELANYTGRKVANLSRTLHTMERYGIVELIEGEKRTKRPVVKASDFRVRFSL